MGEQAAPYTVARSWRLVLPGRLPAANELARLPLHGRIAAKVAWRQSVYWAAREAGVPPLGRARVTFTRHSAGRPDDDNLISGCKAARDGLLPIYVVDPGGVRRKVAEGVVDDDDPGHLCATYRAERCARGKARLEIVIEEWTMGG